MLAVLVTVPSLLQSRGIVYVLCGSGMNYKSLENDLISSVNIDSMYLQREDVATLQSPGSVALPYGEGKSPSRECDITRARRVTAPFGEFFLAPDHHLLFILDLL